MAGRALNRPMASMASLVLVPLAAKRTAGGAWQLVNTVVPQLAQVGGDADTLVVTLDDTYIQFISCQATVAADTGTTVKTIVFDRAARTITIELSATLVADDAVHVLAVFSEQIVA